MIGIWTV